MKTIIHILLLIPKIMCFNLCVVGGSSGLGKEIIYQALQSNNKVLALTKSPNKITIPFRNGGLEEKFVGEEIINNNLVKDNYNNYNKYNFKNIIFTLGGTAFKNDYSDKITQDILNNYKYQFNNIILISANGVGDSLSNSNLGIKIMNDWYLRDVYRAKNRQELLVKEYELKSKKTKAVVLRPECLSFGENAYDCIPREKLAKKILVELNLL